MKKLIGLLAVIFITSTGQVFAQEKAIGDSYQGGKIAYILQSGDPGYDAKVRHGLIAATADQSIEEGGVQWYNGSYTTTGATATELGTGLVNTNKIIKAQGAGSYAAQLCADYTNKETGTGVYSDWYLPSKDELDKLYLNETVIGGFASYAFYWSSSEVNLDHAWFQHFSDGYKSHLYKSYNDCVRCARAF